MPAPCLGREPQESKPVSACRAILVDHEIRFLDCAQQTEVLVSKSRCGRQTEEAGIKGVCGVCWWEDDGQDDPQADEVRGGPNGKHSLSAARANFFSHGHMYDRGKGIQVVERPLTRAEFIANEAPPQTDEACGEGGSEAEPR